MARLAQGQPLQPRRARNLEPPIPGLFPGWDLDLDAYTLAPPIARLLGRATPVLYPLMHSLQPLRFHLIGRLRCPTSIQRGLALVFYSCFSDP